MSSRPKSMIVSPSSEARDRFVEIFYNLMLHHQLYQVGNLREAISRLNCATDPGEVELVFVSGCFPDYQVVNFIEKAKSCLAGEDSTYVLLLTPEDRDRVSVVSGTLAGADGCLVEPFGVSHLEEVVNLSKKIKVRRQMARKAAVSLLVNESIVCLDEIAKSELEDQAPGKCVRYFRKIGKVIFALSHANLEDYYRIAVTKFSSCSSNRFLIEGGNDSSQQPQIQELYVPEELEDRYLNKSIFRLKNLLHAEGVESEFIDVAIRKICSSMKSQGIEASFVGKADPESLKEAARKKIINRLRNLCTEKGIQAEFLAEIHEGGSE